MDRRDFLAASAAAGLGLLGGAPAGAAEEGVKRQWIELRVIHFSSAEQMGAFEQFIDKVAIPAYGRAGIAPVGCFKLLAKDNAALKLEKDPLDLYLVLPHESAEGVLTHWMKLGADAVFQKEGKEILIRAKDKPAYTRVESSLLAAFSGFPTLVAPTKAATRLFQLRTYEAPSMERNNKKVAMFQEGGELAIFKKVGMNGVFFGQALVGSKLPNLTYMVAFDDEAARDKGWAGFRDDPDWKKLSKDAQYDNTVSTITNLVLRPAAGSQI